MNSQSTFNASNFVDKLINSGYEYRIESLEGHLANSITAEIKQRGGVFVKATSECTIASKEKNILLGKHHFNIIEGNFMGKYTEVLMTIEG